MKDDDNDGEGVSLGQPVLRQWELTSESTRYENIVAAPSDEQLHTMWSVWSAIFFLYSALIITVFLGVISSRRVRKKSFNLYLIYLMIPDVVYAIICAIQCACLAYFGGYRSSAACKFQSIYLIFGNAANSWLNGVIAYEVHQLLKASHNRQRYFPPTRKEVSVKATAVYAFSLFIAVLGVVNIPWLPHDTRALRGLVCLPLETDLASTIFFWAVFYPLLSFIPLAYAVWVTYSILKNNLLPNNGNRRQLAIYYFRIVLCFFIMWLPGLLVLWVTPDANVWVTWGAGFWLHSQGAVSATVSLLKPDIYQAVKQFVTCRCNDDDVGELSLTSFSRTDSSRFFLRGSSHHMIRPPSLESAELRLDLDSICEDNNDVAILVEGDLGDKGIPEEVDSEDPSVENHGA